MIGRVAAFTVALADAITERTARTLLEREWANQCAALGLTIDETMQLGLDAAMLGFDRDTLAQTQRGVTQ